MSDQPSYQLASPRGPLRQSRASRASSVSLRSERWSKTSEDPQLLLDAAVAATELRDGVSVLSDAQLRVAWCAATMSGVYPGQAPVLAAVRRRTRLCWAQLARRGRWLPSSACSWRRPSFYDDTRDEEFEKNS